MKRYGIWNDIHFPFEDRQRYLISLLIAKDLGLDHIFLNGDIGEFQGVSTYPVHPGERTSFCEELDYMNKKFDEIMKLFPDVPVTYICGNHEHRFFRYIRDLAPQMWGLIDCPAILKFDERPRWKFVDYGPSQLVKCGDANLYLRHEPLGTSRNHARITAETSLVDIAYGHTHAFELSTHRKFGPTPITTKAYSLGFLGDKSRHVFDYRGSKDSWVEGFTIVETLGGDYSLEFIDLRKIPAYYRGKKYNAPI